jgi:hypothetical protein
MDARRKFTTHVGLVVARVGELADEMPVTDAEEVA